MRYPLNVVWLSGGATLQTIAGVSWFDKEYFVLDAPPLVREMKRDLMGEIVIGECELLVTIISSLLWGKEVETIGSSLCAPTTITYSRGYKIGRKKWAWQSDCSEL